MTRIEGTPYHGGWFRVGFTFGDDFPASPPKCESICWAWRVHFRGTRRKTRHLDVQSDSYRHKPFRIDPPSFGGKVDTHGINPHFSSENDLHLFTPLPKGMASGLPPPYGCQPKHRPVVL